MNPLAIVDFPVEHEPRAYVNSSIRFHHEFTERERLAAAENAGWNVFQFPSEMLKGGDLLSDSGTTTLTVEQIAAMFLLHERRKELPRAVPTFGADLTLRHFKARFELESL